MVNNIKEQIDCITKGIVPEGNVSVVTTPEFLEKLKSHPKVKRMLVKQNG